MPLEKHPTKPDMLVFRANQYALNWRDEHNKDIQIAELTRERDDALRLLAMAHLNIRQHLEYGFNPKTAQSTLISVGQIAPLLAENIKFLERQQCEFGQMCVYCNSPEVAR